METHIKVVAVLNTILGAMGVISALIVLLIFGGIAGLVRVSGDADAAGRRRWLAELAESCSRSCSRSLCRC